MRFLMHSMIFLVMRRLSVCVVHVRLLVIMMIELFVKRKRIWIFFIILGVVVGDVDDVVGVAVIITWELLLIVCGYILYILYTKRLNKTINIIIYRAALPTRSRRRGSSPSTA